MPSLKQTIRRLLSRKFLTVIAVIIACTTVAHSPEVTCTTKVLILRIAALIVMGLTACGYIFAESSVDKQLGKKNENVSSTHP